MCCGITNSLSAQSNGSCCPEHDAINLFTIGSELGTAWSISHSATPKANINAAPTSLILTSSQISSSATSSPVSSRSEINGKTIAIAVSTSVGAVSAILLIVAGFLIHQVRRRRRRKLEQNHMGDLYDRKEVDSLKEVFGPTEISGKEEYELSTSTRDMTQELPE